MLANGSVAALAACFHSLSALAVLALLGAVAAATADTWAAEVGIRLRRQPRSILTLRPRPPGTSGAVSLPGTLGSAAVALGGVAGSLADSLAGDSVQAVYRCPVCGASPEVARHAGSPERTVRVSGVPGLENDAVSWIATATGAAGTVLFYQLLLS